jgi:hypothetical protein
MDITFVQGLIVIFVIYVCVYSLISRVCSCIEHCATSKAYESLKEAEAKLFGNDKQS